MRKEVFIVLILVFVGTKLFAQANRTNVQIGFGVGTLNYSGDITTEVLFDKMWEEIGDNGIISLKLSKGKKWGFGVDLTRGTIHAHDYNYSNSDRGFELTTSINQLNIYTEFAFLRFYKRRRNNGNGVLEDLNSMNFFLKGGVGGAFYSPNLTINDSSSLKNKEVFTGKYAAANLMLGGGYSWCFTPRQTIQLDVSVHFLTKDNLDGFEFTQFNTANDVYGGVNIRYYYSL